MTGCQRVCKTLVSCIEGRASLIQDQEMSSSPSGIHLRKQWAYDLNISKFTSLTGIFCIFILGEYEGPVRHVGIEVVGGVHGMVLDTPSEDDRGQRVRQLIPEQTFYNFDIGLCFWKLVEDTFVSISAGQNFVSAAKMRIDWSIMSHFSWRNLSSLNLLHNWALAGLPPAGPDEIVVRIQLHTPRLAPPALGSVELCKISNVLTFWPFNLPTLSKGIWRQGEMTKPSNLPTF